jgi:hypothetical protein
MPKRVLDFDALWASDKIAACAEWAQAEYAWLYGLADACGSFELTNLRVIWGRVAAVRKNLSLERLEQVFDEFHAKGLLFLWEENGKRYGHWTGSDVPGRLPPPSWRHRLERLAPAVPAEQLAEYSSGFSRSAVRASSGALSNLKAGVEAPQAQEEELERDWKGEVEREEEPAGSAATALPASLENGTPSRRPSSSAEGAASPQALLEIYDQERGALPAARELTPRRASRCAALLREQRGAEEAFLCRFREAVRRARATPFLCGVNDGRWRATFDWFVARSANCAKVLEGRYDAFARRDGPAQTVRSAIENAVQRELLTGAGPPGPVRVRPEILERERERRRNAPAGGGGSPRGRWR